MIVKPFEERNNAHKDPRREAGYRAERQMAHYLGRVFGESENVAVLHDVRLVDETRTEVDGGPVVAQMDHLVLHRYGAFIVESKSCLGSVRVSPSGSGRDEWAIRSKGQRTYTGMKSPLQQAQRQGEVLLGVLESHHREVLGKRLGIRQRHFKDMPLQVVAAIADGGQIEYEGGWKPKQKPFRDSVEKADQAAQFVRDEILAHRANDTPISYDSKSEYGWWRSKPEEVLHTARLLCMLHRPVGEAMRSAPPDAPEAKAPEIPPPPERSRTTGSACRKCNESDRLDPRPGRYGPYWKCLACGTNTTMPKRCAACGCDDRDRDRVRVAKKDDAFVRSCDACGVSEVVDRIRPA